MADCCVLFVVCCLVLVGGWCLLTVVECSLFAVCGVLFAVRCLSCVACWSLVLVA